VSGNRSTVLAFKETKAAKSLSLTTGTLTTGIKMMLSRVEWIPPPPPQAQQPSGTEIWLARVTVVAGLCLAVTGFLASLL
jgi:hypothetical protein